MDVILLMAQTLDGKIARTSDHFANWTGKEDKRFFMEETKKAGVVIMGSKTFEVMGDPLPDRYNIIMTRDKSKNYKGIRDSEDFAFTGLPPESILLFLKFMNYDRAFLIGGSEVNTAFAQADLIDKVFVTIVPKFFGKGLSIFTDDLYTDLIFKSQQTFKDGGILLKYDVKKGL